MRLSEIRIGSNRLWYSIFFLCGLAMLLSPSIWAGIDYVRTPHTIACESFSLHIPLYWLVSKDMDADCAHGVGLVRISPTALGSIEDGSILNIERDEPNSAQDTSVREQTFRMVNKDALIIPYSLNSEFNQCLQADTQFKGRSISTAMCADEARGIVLNFHGSSHALKEVSAIIQPR
jgi:hypothetical protein